MPVDIDSWSRKPKASINDGEALALEALKMLDIEGTRCTWQLTGSHGVKGHRIRLWLRLKNARTPSEMRAFAEEQWAGLSGIDHDGSSKPCVDSTIYTASSLIFTAPPHFT